MKYLGDEGESRSAAVRTRSSTVVSPRSAIYPSYSAQSPAYGSQRVPLRTCSTGFATLPAAGVTTCAVRAANSLQSVSAVPFFV